MVIAFNKIYTDGGPIKFFHLLWKPTKYYERKIEGSLYNIMQLSKSREIKRIARPSHQMHLLHTPLDKGFIRTHLPTLRHPCQTGHQHKTVYNKNVRRQCSFPSILRISPRENYKEFRLQNCISFQKCS